jgi:hypothetical protein
MGSAWAAHPAFATIADARLPCSALYHVAAGATKLDLLQTQAQGLCMHVDLKACVVQGLQAERVA